MKLDPRISPLFKDNAGLAFIAALLCALVAALAPKALAAVLDEAGDTGVDWSERVAGKPLRVVNSKSAVQLLREGYTVEDIESVRKAYKDRGLEFPDGDPRKIPADAYREQLVALGIIKPRESVDLDPTEPEKGNPADGGTPAAPAPVLFAGRPLGDYAGKSDAEMLKMENVNKATLAKIKAALAAAK